MAYEQAAKLLHLALDIAGHRYGMTFAEIDREYSNGPTSTARRRNTQRMVAALEEIFGDQFEAAYNDDGERCVFLRSERLRSLDVLRAEEMSALDHAIAMLAGANSVLDAANLKALRSRIRLLAPLATQTKLETDLEAQLGANHVFVRPGPQPKINADEMRPLAEALLALRKVSFDYPHDGGVKCRTVTPYGIISGYRAYLVALVDGATGRNPTTWRIDRMSDVKVLEDKAEIPPDFSLAAHAKRSFGAYFNEAEYGEVEWRFSPKVAANALSYRFHPDQVVTAGDDGSVTVRFSAAGYLEMAWALYAWGDKVEVIKPEALRKMVEGHQRSDFPGVP